ncbi:MAG: guanylate kinase [Legionella sp.]|nr:guanylate kinase [Legionella sp.]
MTESITGNVFIVAAPSGGGKTSLVNELVTKLENIDVSISHTTRASRPGELHGKDYFFVSESQFMEMVNDNAFIEHACVFNHHYGTSVAEINDRLAKGIDVVLDIDWQGAAQIRRLYPDAISIFIIPPSLTVLQQRLQGRGQDDDQVINNRMQRAKDELSHFSEFDYLIVNDNFDNAFFELQSIVIANRLSFARQSRKIGKLLSLLLSSQ